METPSSLLIDQPEDAAQLGQQAEVDAGERPGTTTAEAPRIAELEREVRELG